MQQNASRDSWTFEQTEARLAIIMRDIHDGVGAQLVGLLSLISKGRTEQTVLQEHARAALDEVHQIDLDQVDGAGLLALGLSPGRFDVLLALDVLEHLYDPWEVLCRHVELVRPGGHVVISLPNIQNITTLLGLSEGQWSYQAEGILDATHLRFFTLPTAELLVSGAGLKMVHLASVFNPPLDQSRLKDQDNQISHGRLTLSKLAREEVFTFFAYQYLLVAQRPLSDNRGAAAALAT